MLACFRVVWSWYSTPKLQVDIIDLLYRCAKHSTVPDTYLTAFSSKVRPIPTCIIASQWACRARSVIISIIAIMGSLVKKPCLLCRQRRTSGSL